MIFDENVIRKPRVGIEHFFVRWDMASDWRDIVIQSVYGGDDFHPILQSVYSQTNMIPYRSYICIFNVIL